MTTTELSSLVDALSFEIIFDDERYTVQDAVFGPVTVSITKLHQEQATRGHSHEHPELLIVNSGAGLLKLGSGDAPEAEDEWVTLMPGFALVIPGGAFHRVITGSGVEFTNVFEGERSH